MTRRSGLLPSLSLLTAARLVINTAHRLVYPFLPVIARGLGISLERAGLLVSVRWAAGLATPAVSATVGRGERRKRQIIAGLGLFVSGASVTAATSVFVGALAGFALMGVAKPAFDVAAQAYLADRVAYEKRARVLGVFEITYAGALLIGAPAAGWLIDRFAWEAPFWALAGLAALAAATAFWVLAADRPHERGTAPLLSWDRPAVAFLGVLALFAGGAEVLFVVFGAWLEDSFGLSIVALGGTSVLIGLAELVGEGATVAVTDRLGKRRSLAAGLIVAAAGYLLLIPAGSSQLGGLAALALGLAGFEFAILASVPLQTEIKPHARVRYLSWAVVTMGTARAVGAGLGPVLYGAYGIAGNSITAAAASAAAIWALLAWVDEPGARVVDVSPAAAGEEA
jgi:predicted MFS family arabinose efflux permease